MTTIVTYEGDTVKVAPDKYPDLPEQFVFLGINVGEKDSSDWGKAILTIEQAKKLVHLLNEAVEGRGDDEAD